MMMMIVQIFVAFSEKLNFTKEFSRFLSYIFAQQQVFWWLQTLIQSWIAYVGKTKADDLFQTGKTTVAQYCGTVASVGVLTI